MNSVDNESPDLHHFHHKKVQSEGYKSTAAFTEKLDLIFNSKEKLIENTKLIKK